MKDSWIETSRFMPDPGVEVLVYSPDRRIIGPVLVGVYFEDTEMWSVYDFHDTVRLPTSEVTHWQPILLPQ